MRLKGPSRIQAARHPTQRVRVRDLPYHHLHLLIVHLVSAVASASIVNGPKGANRTAKSDGIQTEFTGDKTRDKCMELIYDALASDSGARGSFFCQCGLLSSHNSSVASELILNRSRAIEKTVLLEFDGTTATYKNKIRSLYVNLKDKSNPSLRACVVSGELPVERFCKMKSQVRAANFDDHCEVVMLLAGNGLGRKTSRGQQNYGR